MNEMNLAEPEIRRTADPKNLSRIFPFLTIGTFGIILHRKR